MSMWQPIETAPRDGSQLLLLAADFGALQGRWDAKEVDFYKSLVGYPCYDPDNMHGTWVTDLPGVEDRRLVCGMIPTHWMPLPEPPETER